MDSLPAAAEDLGPNLSNHRLECILEQATETDANHIAIPITPRVDQSIVRCDPLTMLHNYSIARDSVGHLFVH